MLLAIIWRDQIQSRKVKRELQDYQKQLEASFSLNGYLLEAQDEKSIVMAAMQSGKDLLGAIGCAFVPLDEWRPSFPVLKLGDLAFLDDSNWQMRLSEPETRHACRNCKDKQAGSECVLLQKTSQASNVYCVALRCGGREIGVATYFFSEEPYVTISQKAFLGHMVRMTDLVLDASRMHTQELDALRNTLHPTISENELENLNHENRDILEQLKYQAVMDERTRLAREIHDGLAQTLAFLKMEASRLQSYVIRGEIDSIDATLSACYRTLSDAYLDARQAIDNLRRVPSEKLADWLALAASDFKILTGFSVDVSNIDLEYTFPDSVKAQLIRIVQEALTNIRKHAQACTVSISAFQRGSEAILVIKDNGHGFAPDDVDPATHYGLRSMRERAETIDADFQVISAPGMGTTVRLQIPIRAKENS